MGAEARKHSPPPATLTESSLAGDDAVATATDLSRRSEKTSFSIPEDGSPLTIDTNQHSKAAGLPASQTSLLIEFFEGGKNPTVTPSAKPSVRVRVTPPRKGSAHDHVQITESAGVGHPSHTHRISLRPGESRVERLDDESSVSGPVDIDIAHRHLGSDLSGTSVSNHEYYSNLPSEVSSMPPESALEPTPPAELTPKKARSPSLSHEDMVTKETLHAPKGKEAAVSREQLTQKVIEKLGQEPRKVSSGKRHSSKSRSRSVSKEHLAESTSSPRRRSGKHRRSSGEHTSDPSLLTASQVSESRSHRSGTSKSSINPKLVETVEDAIRRLILPELTALKQEQKTQKNLEKFEQIEKGRRLSTASGSTASREEIGRRLSKHSSDPDVRVRSKRRSHKHSSPKDRFDREASEETVIRDHDKALRRRSKDKDSHRLRDAAAGALIGGVLTREALKHHDSQSSVERRERRRRRSGKSHSRSDSRHDSMADTDELFQKHDVPPMPMRSELTGSDLTRDSILSERTSTPTSEHRRHEIRQFARKDPRKADSPIELTRDYDGAKYLGGNARGVTHEEIDVRHAAVDDHYGHGDNLKSGLAGAALGAATASALSGYRATGAHYYDELDDHPYGGGHTLSPIQSVASFEEAGDDLQKQKLRRVHSTGSLESLEQHHEKQHLMHEAARSVDSLSLDDTHVGKTRRRGMVFEGAHEALRPHSFRSSDDQSYDNRYRDSMDSERVSNRKHLSMNTNTSEAISYGDNASAAQEVREVGANVEYIGTPMGVESAVASLLDLDSAGNTRVDDDGQPDAMDVDYDYGTRDLGDLGSPLKHEIRHEDLRTHARPVYSPRQSAASPIKDTARSSRSYRDRYSNIPMGHSGVPDMNDPLPEVGYRDSKSDISTNPSYIQGTAGGEKEPWLLNQSREKVKSDSGSGHDSLRDAARNALLVAAGAGAGAAALGARGSHKSSERDRSELHEQPHFYEDEERDMRGEEVFTPQKLERQSLPGDDEGYATGAHARSPSLTPDHRGKAPPIFGASAWDAGIDEEDPFTGTHKRTLSGNSHGMGSPLYDGAMGKGIDNIQNKDIVALMNHLMVRDAQRSARDTEMLTTLVSCATEQRTGFEEMKRFIADQDELLVEVGNKQHEKTQRVINGPRPLPAATAHRGSSEDFTEDVPQKRRSAFRRAFKGFGGGRNNNSDIARLEQMMTHLLDEIAELKAAQGIEPSPGPKMEQYQTAGLTSYENLRDGRSGYEPEGQAGTGSAANSGYFSNPSLRQSAGAGFSRRRGSENRVSTVLEAEEEENDAPLEPHEEQILGLEDPDQFTTPTRATRQTSVPLVTPPATQAAPGPASAENTPRTERSKKHKSTSSSFLPKFSRWSRTTASTVADNFRNSARRERPNSEVSHSGSEGQNYDVMESYDPAGDDRIRSNSSLNQDRPASPLVPSGVSERPTYQVHRDSLNLQHPQPRQGPTARFQNHLESQVQDRSPVSPTSDQFGSNPILARFSGGAGNRYSGHSAPGNLSPISDHDKTPPPPRPPKIRDEGPLIPPKVPLDNPKPAAAGRSIPSGIAAKNGPAFARSPNQRKPSGPRPISSSRSYTPDRGTTQRSTEDITF